MAASSAQCCRVRQAASLDLVTSGTQDGLLSVRRFLDGARGGLNMQLNMIDEAFKPYDDTEIVFR